MRCYLTHGDIDFSFTQTQNDFFVEEIPLREFENRGRYLILKVRKHNMTTWDMLQVFQRFLNIEPSSIGYAGLKDKHATTVQYLSLDARLEGRLKRFKHKSIEIMERFRDTKSIRMGDLRGNRFGINLYDMDEKKAGRAQKIAAKIQKNGLANYFGYQRFGSRGDALQEAREMLSGERFIKDKKVRNFLVSVYQSHLFNEWLKERVGLSDEGKFKLLSGDVYMTKEEKLFTPKSIPLQNFLEKRVSPTGLLPGRDVYRARAEAAAIEKRYDDEFLPYKGHRRAAIIWPEEFSLKLYAKEKRAHVSFFLPKGAYATVLLEALKGEEISANS